MMDDQFLSNLLQNTNIVDVIGAYVQLKRSGSNYKACCPFHSEKTGSFLVSETKQIYKCFGCGKAGNAITFVRDYEKISFSEAVKKLADRINLQIPDTIQKKEKNSKIDLIYKIYELANHFFIENLKRHGTYAKKYLSSRQISEETIEKFSIGYSLDSFSALKNYLKKNFINEQIMAESGLFKEKESSLYDMFRDRIMFPITTANGNIVAFGARALTADQEKQGKYINSPTTAIYTKGKELYGLNISRFEISKRSSAIIVEGYMDFLRMWESGFQNTVASLGTALTEEQVQILSRYTKNILMLYDGDKAGMNSAIKAASIILKKGLNAKIICLPNSEDPDSFLLKHPSDEMTHIINQAVTLSQFLKNHPEIMNTQQSIEYLIEITHQMNDPVQKELYFKEISENFKISETSIREKASQKKHFYEKPETKTTSTTEKLNYEEEKLLQSMLKSKENIKKIASAINLDYFINDKMKRIFKILTENEVSNYLENSAELLNYFEEEDLSNEISSLLLANEYEFDIDDLIRQIKLRKYQEDIKKINEEIIKNPDNAELFEQKIFLKKEIQSLSKSVVNKTLF